MCSVIVWTGNAQAGARLQMLHERQALVLPDLWTFLEKPIFHVKFTTKNKKDNNNKIGQAKQSRSMDCQFNFHPDARICCQVFRPWPSALSTSHVYGLSSGPQVLLPAGFLIHSVGLVFLKVAEIWVGQGLNIRGGTGQGCRATWKFLLNHQIVFSSSGLFKKKKKLRNYSNLV